MKIFKKNKNTFSKYAKRSLPHAKQSCKKNSKIGILCTEATIKTKVYSKYFDKGFELVSPGKKLQKNSVNKAIKFVKWAR